MMGVLTLCATLRDAALTEVRLGLAMLADLGVLVELSPCNETTDQTTARLPVSLEGIGKVRVSCKASPGAIVPRIQALTMNEAARLVEEGVDKAVEYGFDLRFDVLMRPPLV